MTTGYSKRDNLLRIKNFTEEMLTWVSGKGKILIIIHDHPDPDCLASAMALRHLFIVKLNRDAIISFSGAIGRSENITMAKELEIPLTPLSSINPDDYKVICMLDTQPGTGNNSLPPWKKVDIVIDHHPIRDTSRNCRWLDIREKYGVTATILYEYLLAQNIYIGTKLATALFYAVKSETQDLGREATISDRDAYIKLFPLTNKKLLFEIGHPKLPKDHFLVIHKAVSNAKIYGTALIVNLLTVNFPEVVAEMADIMIQLEGIETVLCLGKHENDVILSLRTTSHEHNAGEIISKLVSERGTAGGHMMTAGGKLENVPCDQSALEEIENHLTKDLLKELSLGDEPPRNLLPA